MPLFLPATTRAETRIMMVVDGENLAKRYGAILGEDAPMSHVHYQRDVYVWSPYASRSLSDISCHPFAGGTAMIFGRSKNSWGFGMSIRP